MNSDISVTARTAIVVFQIGFILLAACLGRLFFRKLHLPSVLGELMAGIVIGPCCLGSIGLPLEGLQQGLFPRLSASSGLAVSPELYCFSTIGSVILLFMSGLETDLHMFFRYSLAGTVIGIGGAAVSFFFGDWLGMATLDAAFGDPRCLFIGILCTATSVGITARILSEKRSMESPEGTSIMAAAVIDDVLGIICLAVVIGLVGSKNTARNDWGHIVWISLRCIGIWLVFLVIGLLGAHRMARCLKKLQDSSGYAVLSLAFAMLLAGIFERSGLAMIIGAYVAGLTLSKTDISYKLQDNLCSVYNLCVPVFFVVMGMMVDVQGLADGAVLRFGLLYSLVAICGKVIGCMLPSLLMNFNLRGALRIGIGMIPRGEIALITAGIGATTMMKLHGTETPIINSQLFGGVIIMTLLTTAVAPPCLALVLGQGKKGVRREVQHRGMILLTFPMPAAAVRDYVIRELVGSFRKEGFRHSNYSRDNCSIHFRREKASFLMMSIPDGISFECSILDVATIKAVVHETTMELLHTMSQLQRFSVPPPEQKAYAKEDLRSCLIPFEDLEEGDSLASILPLDCILPSLKASGYRDAIGKIVAHMAETKHLGETRQCLEDLFAREEQSSTMLEEGIAMPHARTVAVEHMISAVALCQMDNLPLREIIVLTLAPKNSPCPYVQYISHIASVLLNCRNLDEVRQLTDARELYRLFTEATN